MKDETPGVADPLLRPAQVRAAFGGVSESALYEWINLGLIPPPVRLSRRVTGWPRSVVERVMAERAAGNLPRVDREAVRKARREARAARAAKAAA